MAEYTTSSKGDGHVEALFASDDNKRQANLGAARTAASLTIRTSCPPKDWDDNTPLPQNFQSLGARCISNVVGKTLLNTFSPDRPWILQELAADVLYDPTVSEQQLQAWQQILFKQDLLILATIESANYSHEQGDLLGFWTIQRQALAQIFVTGDLLQRMDSEYRLTNFRRDNYVTKRNDSGAVCYHVTKEGKDPLELSDEQLKKCGLDAAKLAEKKYHERCLYLYTHVEFQPRGKNWVIRQEFNGHVFNVSQEPITNHFSCPYDLAPGANYGVGLTENNMGDLEAFDALNESTRNFAVAASKINPILDPGSDLVPKDLEDAQSGDVLSDRVEGGRPKHIAMLQSDKLSDFSIVMKTMEVIRSDLGKAFLLDSESVRQSERTTLGEVEQVTLAEATGNQGGVLAPVQDKMQLPLFFRARHQLRMEKRDGRPKLPTLSDKAVSVRVLSGIQALARAAKAGRLIKFAEVAQELDPNGQYINKDVLFDVLARMQGISEPGMIYTPDERAALRQQAMKEAAQAAAAQQAIQSTGAIAEQQAATGATQNG